MPRSDKIVHVCTFFNETNGVAVYQVGDCIVDIPPDHVRRGHGVSAENGALMVSTCLTHLVHSERSTVLLRRQCRSRNVLITICTRSSTSSSSNLRLCMEYFRAQPRWKNCAGSQTYARCQCFQLFLVRIVRLDLKKRWLFSGKASAIERSLFDISVIDFW